MTRDADHVLDAIDGALADWNTSVDAMRWTPDRDPLLVPFTPGLSLVARPVTDEEWARLAAAMAPAIRRSMEQAQRVMNEQIVPAIQRAAKNLARYAQHLEETGVLDQLRAAHGIETPPPVDPRERALHAVHHRNTGPALQHRPPRRIDPVTR
jgi:hypothetical protein